jgi:hypothetical protein
MQSPLTAFGRFLTSVALVTGAFGVWLMSRGAYRVLSALRILVFAICAVIYVVTGRHRSMIRSGVVLALLLVSPIEVSLATRAGPPGVVPLVMGLPGRALRERATRGEVVLGGCMVGGLEPRWVVIW